MADEDTTKGEATEDEETQEDDSTQEGDDNGEGEEETPVDPEEYKRMAVERDKIREQLKKRNQDLVRLRNKANEAKQKDKGEESSKETELLETLKRKEEEATKWRTQTILASASSALATEGVASKHLKRAAKLIDASQLDLDDDGNLIGLESQVDELREEFPEFFRDEETEKKTVRTRRPAPKNARRDAGDKDEKGESRKKMSSAEKLAMNLVGECK